MRLLALLLLAAAGCTSPLLDEPSKVRHGDIVLPPLYSSERSEDGTSFAWSALFWLIGQDVESDRRHARALPFYWHDEVGPYRERTLWFPFYYSRRSATEEARFFSLLYGYEDGEDVRSDYVLLPFFRYSRSTSDASDYWRSGLFPIWDWRHQDGQDEATFLSLLGLATVAHTHTGFPDGGSKGSIANALGIVELFGWNSVGDTREWRVLTLFSNEVLSPIRSWRSKDGGPFVREWLFPLYLNVQDEGSSWIHVGPLWGEIDETDWWLLGLVTRSSVPEGNTWRVLGIPVSSP